MLALLTGVWLLLLPALGMTVVMFDWRRPRAHVAFAGSVGTITFDANAVQHPLLHPARP